MTDIQAIVGAITLVGGAIATSIRWGTGRMARAQDRSVAALVRSAESSAMLATRFESLTDQIGELALRFDRLVEALISGGVLPPAPIPTAIVRREGSQRMTTPAPGTRRAGKGKARSATARSGEPDETPEEP